MRGEKNSIYIKNLSLFYLVSIIFFKINKYLYFLCLDSFPPLGQLLVLKPMMCRYGYQGGTGTRKPVPSKVPVPVPVKNAGTGTFLVPVLANFSKKFFS